MKSVYLIFLFGLMACKPEIKEETIFVDEPLNENTNANKFSKKTLFQIQIQGNDLLLLPIDSNKSNDNHKVQDETLQYPDVQIISQCHFLSNIYKRSLILKGGEKISLLDTISEEVYSTDKNDSMIDCQFNLTLIYFDGSQMSSALSKMTLNLDHKKSEIRILKNGTHEVKNYGENINSEDFQETTIIFSKKISGDLSLTCEHFKVIEKMNDQRKIDLIELTSSRNITTPLDMDPKIRYPKQLCRLSITDLAQEKQIFISQFFSLVFPLPTFSVSIIGRIASEFIPLQNYELEIFAMKIHNPNPFPITLALPQDSRGFAYQPVYFNNHLILFAAFPAEVTSISYHFEDHVLARQMTEKSIFTLPPISETIVRAYAHMNSHCLNLPQNYGPYEKYVGILYSMTNELSPYIEQTYEELNPNSYENFRIAKLNPLPLLSRIEVTPFTQFLQFAKHISNPNPFWQPGPPFRVESIIFRKGGNCANYHEIEIKLPPLQ